MEILQTLLKNSITPSLLEHKSQRTTDSGIKKCGIKLWDPWKGSENPEKGYGDG
jgi:hypothetical protein